MSNVWLVKATPYDIAGAAEVMLYFSTGRPDGLAPVYDGKLWPVRAASPLNVEVTVFAGEFGGAVPAFGTLQLDIGGQGDEGELDALLDYAWDGRDIWIYRGVPTDAFGSMTLVFRGTARSVSWNRRTLTINLSDYAELLAKPAQTTLYAGTGGAEGGDDLTGKNKPLAFGPAKNLEPTLVDSTYLVYQFHSRAAEAVDAAFDGGVALTATADYASYALLIAATVPSGCYATCLAEGLVRLGAPVAFVLTLDVKGDASGTGGGGGYVDTAADIIERHAVDFTDLTGSNVNAASFTALNTANSAACALYVATGENPSAADLYTQLMISVGGFWTMNAAAEIVVRQVAFGSAVATLTEAQVVDVERLETPPPFWRRKMGYARAWRVHAENEIAAAAGVVNIGVLPNRVTFASSENKKAFLHGFDSAGLAADTDGSYVFGGTAITVDRSQFADGSSIKTSQTADGYIVHDSDPRAVVVRDTFTAGAGTELSSHTPDTGTSWTERIGGTPNLDIVASGSVAPDASSSTARLIYSCQPAPSTAAMAVEATVGTWASATTDTFYLLTRVASSGTCFGLSVKPSSTTGMADARIWRLPNASGGTALTSIVQIPKVAGLELRLEVNAVAMPSLYAYYRRPLELAWTLFAQVLNTTDVTGTEGGLGFGDLSNGTMTETMSTAWRIQNFRLTEAGGSFTVSAEAVAAAFVRLNGTDWQYDNGSGWTTFTPPVSAVVIGRLTTDGTQISAASITVPQRLSGLGTTVEPKARVDFIKQAQRFVTSELSAVKTVHKLAREAEVSSLLADEADADTENDRQHALLDSMPHLYQATIQQSLWDTLGLALGDTVTLKIASRFGLAGGKDFIVGGKAAGRSADWARLLLWGGV